MDVKKSDNKSLIIYTSLIFLAAIAMIVLSFFGQKHLDDERVSSSENEIVTLANKNAAVSEENLQLLELNKTLKTENNDLKEENSKLISEKDTLTKENTFYKELHKVSEKIIEGKNTEAMKLLGNIYTEDLTPEQKIIYDYLVKAAQSK